MEAFFADPNLERKPPEETRLRSLQANPFQDGKRIRVTIEVTPFQKRPNIEVVLLNSSGEEMTSASIIEPMAWKLELTLHVREGATDGKETSTGTPQTKRLRVGPCTLTVSLSYPDLGEIDRREIKVKCWPQD